MSWLASLYNDEKISVEDGLRLSSMRDLVLVAGIDVDGQLRGKFLSRKKLRGANYKIGFCSVVFGWDLNDDKYTTELAVSNADNGYKDLMATIDPASLRDIEFGTEPQYGSEMATLALVYFSDETSDKPLPQCPRSLLRSTLSKFDSDVRPLAGMELEFYNYKETSISADAKGGRDLKPLTVGMHGYSVLRPQMNANYWNLIRKKCDVLEIPLECFHSETGPGVYEVALEYTDAAVMADRATLFKYACRKAGSLLDIVPNFMAKPASGMPGNSGHLHVSLMSKDGKNLFAHAPQSSAPFPEVECLSPLGQSFLAGVLEGLQDIMLLFAPNINSYKRLDAAFWAPVTASWGSDHRLASIRLIDAREGAKSCRFEVRIPGADVVPHFALAAIFGLGHRGIEKKLKLTTLPIRSEQDFLDSPFLPSTLKAAVDKFDAKDSVARELFGDEFVDHYAGTRRHELTLWDRAVTEWEVKRYLETA